MSTQEHGNVHTPGLEGLLWSPSDGLTLGQGAARTPQPRASCPPACPGVPEGTGAQPSLDSHQRPPVGWCFAPFWFKAEKKQLGKSRPHVWEREGRLPSGTLWHAVSAALLNDSSGLLLALKRHQHRSQGQHLLGMETLGMEQEARCW